MTRLESNAKERNEKAKEVRTMVSNQAKKQGNIAAVMKVNRDQFLAAARKHESRKRKLLLEEQQLQSLARGRNSHHRRIS